MTIDVQAARRLGATTGISTEVTLITLLGSALKTGDRYLCLYKQVLGGVSGTTIGRLRVGGVDQTEVSSAWKAGSVPTSLKQAAGFLVFTADGISNLTVTAERLGGLGFGASRDEELLCINLDDALVEDTDWFLDENSTDDSSGGGSSFGGEAQPATKTFTPDGDSSYLVFGQLRMIGSISNDNDAFRVQDTTNAVTVAQYGPGAGNIAEKHSMVAVGVLERPASAPITLETQYKTSPAMNKDHAKLLVLRLGAFERSAFFYGDLDATPTGSRESIGSFQYAPDEEQDVVLIGSFTGEVNPGFESGRGYIGDLEYNSGVVDDLTDGGLHISPSQNSTFGKPDSIVGPHFFRLLTGQPITAATVEGFIDAQDGVGTNHTLRYQTLAAFGTVPAPVLEAPLGWGKDPWGTGPWGSATPLDPLAVANALALSTREIEVSLSRAAQALAPTVVGDALNPATWVVQRLDIGFFFSPILVTQTGPETYVVTVLQDLGSVRVQHRILSTTLLDEGGGPISTPPLNQFDFLGVLDAEARDALARARRDSSAVRDVANPPTPFASSLGGSLKINSAGDYENESGPPFVRKMIMRRMSTKEGGFFHLTGYGIGLTEKDLLPASDLLSLRAEIRRQTLLEAEVVSANVRLTLGPSGVLTVRIKADLDTGEEVDVEFGVTAEGVIL